MYLSGISALQSVRNCSSIATLMPFRRVKTQERRSKRLSVDDNKSTENIAIRFRTDRTIFRLAKVETGYFQSLNVSLI